MDEWIRVRHGGVWVSLGFEAKILRLGHELHKKKGGASDKMPPKTKISNRRKTDRQLTILFVF